MRFHRTSCVFDKEPNHAGVEERQFFKFYGLASDSRTSNSFVELTNLYLPAHILRSRTIVVDKVPEPTDLWFQWRSPPEVHEGLQGEDGASTQELLGHDVLKKYARVFSSCP